MRLGTVTAWAEYFEREEGVSIDKNTIRIKLKEAGKIGKDGKHKIGRILMGVFYSEEDVREACASLLQLLPKIDKNGFFELNGETYASTTTWSKCFKDAEEVAISSPTIAEKLKIAGISGITAKCSNNRIWENAYFSKSDVLRVCANLPKGFTRANRNGFLEFNGKVYAPAGIWSKYFKDTEETIIGYDAIVSGLKKAGITGITARDSHGRIRKNTYFSKPDVLEVCKDLLQRLPQAGKDRFFELDAESYASINTWSKYFKNAEGITICSDTIKRRLEKAGITGITAKNSTGRIDKNAYFPESAIRQACADLLTKRKK